MYWCRFRTDTLQKKLPWNGLLNKLWGIIYLGVTTGLFVFTYIPRKLGSEVNGVMIIGDVWTNLRKRIVALIFQDLKIVGTILDIVSS